MAAQIPPVSQIPIYDVNNNLNVNKDDDCSTIDDNEYIVNSDSRMKQLKETYLALFEILPEHFHVREVSLPYYRNPVSEEAKTYFKSPNNIPLMKIVPDLTGSWFDPPHKEDHQDTTTYWNCNTKFPRKPRMTPPEYLLKAPPRAPFYFIEDPNLKLLLEAPIFKSIDLDHSAFDSSACDVSNSTFTNLDSMLRAALFDNFTLDEYLKLIMELIPKVSEEHLTSTDEPLNSLELLMRVVVLAAECNQRSGQAITGTFIANKLALRDYVFNKFVTPSVSRNILRGSNFLSDKLFGNLPESYKNSLKQATGTQLRCKAKTFTPTPSFSTSTISSPSSYSNSSSAEKRPAYPVQSNSAKRGRGGISGVQGRGKGPAPAKKSVNFRKGQNPK